MGNNLREDITGRYVLLKRSILQPQYRENPVWQVFLAQGGFGCKPHTHGTAVFGTFVADGEETRMEGYDIEAYATPEQVMAAQAYYAAHNQPKTPAEQIREALAENPTLLISWAVQHLIHLGAREEWSMEDNFSTTESLAALAKDYGLPAASDQAPEALAFYQAAEEEES